MNTSKFYGWKHLVYFPDVGNNVEILADLLHKKTGKSFDPKAHNTITDAEITREMDWILNHFKILTRKDTKGKITTFNKGAGLSELFKPIPSNQTDVRTSGDLVSVLSATQGGGKKVLLNNPNVLSAHSISNL
jgi:hypothetical protein